MKIFFAFAAVSTIIFSVSCRKEEATDKVGLAGVVTGLPPEPSASYKIILTGKWQSPDHTVPSGNHFTAFSGLVHSSSVFLFKPGVPASLGIENVAEVGNTQALTSEMDGYIAAGKALNKFRVVLPSITAVDSALINLTAQYSFVSFASMIAPSPDWFAGLDSYQLIQNGKWVNDITISISGYDAGTEDGDIFGYNNPATNPQQNVSLMTTYNASVIANGNAGVAPFATVRFIKQ